MTSGSVGSIPCSAPPGVGHTGRRLPSRIEQGLTTVLTGGAGNLREAVRQAVATAQAEALAQLEQVVRSHTAEVRNVASTENPSSPIAALRRDLTATVENTRRELVDGLAAVCALVQADQAHASARSKSSAAGKDFEDAVADIVDDWAKATGDCVEHVGAQPGAGTTRKTGDVVVRVLSSGSNQPTIAIEAKRRVRPLTARQHREELAQAMRVRRAQAALAVVPTPDQVPGPGRFHRVDPNAWVVSSDDPELLRLVLAVVRELTLLTTVQSDGDPAVDLGRAQTAIGHGIQLLSRFDEVTKHTGAAERALTGIRSTADSLQAALAAQLQEAARALQPKA